MLGPGKLVAAGILAVALGATPAVPSDATPAGTPAAPSRRIPAPEGAAAPPPMASPLGEPRGVVDWQRRAVVCSGVAPPALAEESENVAVTRLRTERAALDAAVGACMAALRTITVAPRLGAGELLDGDAALVRDLEKAVRHAPVADPPRLFADGGVAFRLAVPLDGRVGELLLAAADRARARRTR
jgi:hypothetical protein